MSDSTERLGDFLVRVGALTPEHMNKILEYQKENPTILFGQIAIKLEYINQDVLNKYL